MFIQACASLRPIPTLVLYSISISVFLLSTPHLLAQPDAPTNVQVRHIENAEDVSDRSLEVSWDVPAGDVSDYRVWMYRSDRCIEFLQSIETTETLAAFRGLSPDTTYSFDVRARDDGGWSRFSSCVSMTTGATKDVDAAVAEDDQTDGEEESSVPDTPTNVRVRFTSTDAVVLDWNTPANNGDPITGYAVRYYEGATCSGTSATLIAHTSSHIVFGLNPDATYSFEVRAQNSNGWSDFSDCISTLTMDEGDEGGGDEEEPDESGVSEEPSENLSVPTAPERVWFGAVTSSSITVMWNGADDVTGSQVLLYGDDQCVYPMQTVDLQNTHRYMIYRFTGLTPETVHSFNIRAKNDAGQSGFSDCVSTRTERVPGPGAPTNVTVTDTTRGSISLTWDEPDGNEAPVDKYHVGLHHDDQCTVGSSGRETTEPSVTFTGHNVMPGTTYYANVRARNERFYWGPYSDCIPVTTEPLTAPDAPANVRAQVAMPDEITIVWDAPEDIDRRIMAYEVRRYEDAQCTYPMGEETVEKPLYTLTGLVPNTAYHIDVRAQNEVGWSDVSECASVTTTPSLAPDAPTNVRADAAWHEITLTWDEPKDNGSSSVERYRVTVYRGNWGPCNTVLGSRDVSATSATMTGDYINPGVDYYLDVRAQNKKGVWSDPSACVSTATKRITAPDAPTNVAVTDTTRGSISLTWDEPDGNGSPVDKYHANVYHDDQCTVSNGFHKAESPFVTIDGFTIRPGTTYHVAVRARNEQGRWGDYSDCIPATTEPLTVPDAPENVRGVNVTRSAFSIAWDEPVEDGGVKITAYEVHQYEDPVCTYPLEQETVKQTSRAIAGLEPGVEYFYTVRARNEIGWSDHSDCVSVTTEAAPEEPIDEEPVTHPNAPTNLAATDDVSHDSITLSWDDDNDDILHWWLLVYEDAACSQPLSAWESTSRSYTVTGLNPDTTYSFRIAAETSGNLVSDLSECFVSSTEREEGVSDDDAPEEPIDEEPVTHPNAPTNLTATDDVSHDSITLSWDDDNDDILHWWLLVYEDAACSQPLGAWKSTNRSHTVTGLNPDTTYSFHVAAEKSGNLVSDRSECLASSTEKEEGVSDDDAPEEPVDEKPIDEEPIDEEPIDEEPITHPNAPTNLAATDDVSHDSITLSWDDDNDDILRWWLLVYEDAACLQPLGTWKSTNRSYTVTGLDPDTTYSFHVVAENSGNLVSDFSECLVSSTEKEEGVSDDDAPEEPIDEEPVEGSAPTNLRATGVTNDSVALAWDDTNDNVDTWWLLVYEDAACSQSLNVWESASRSYTATGLDPDTEYFFSVIAQNHDGLLSDYSDCLSATTEREEGVSDDDAPEEPIDEEPVEGSAPTNLRATGVTNDSVALAWDDTNDNVDTWWLLVYEDAACSQSLNVWESASRSYTATGLDPDTEYFFSVIAQNHDGLLSDYSDCLSATTEREEGVSDDDAPEEPIDEEPVEGSAPTNLRATGVTNDSVALAWDDTNDNVDTWWLLVYEDAACSQSLNVWESASRSYTATGLDPDTEYFFSVIAQNHDGLLSDYSDCLSATTEREEGVSDDDAPEEPIDEEPVEGSAPTNLRATGVTNDSVALAWDDTNDNVDTWWLLVYEDAACSQSLNVWESASRSYTATGLDPDTEYFFSVIAQNHDGLLSDYSDCLSATTAGE